MTSNLGYDGCSHDELAALGREYLLAGHLIDRAGMPALIAELGLETMRDVAIEEWMAASPIYTRRMQRLLGFEGDDVATIFKGMQFDIGAPHQFMDFRYEVTDHDHGEFWLAHCGALMDVEPMGEEFVVAMCHDIEDPTFDATAVATNPKAQVRPIHRPPRSPADRHPHCHWRVDIVDDAMPLCDPEVMRSLATSKAATAPLPPIAVATDGWNAYPRTFEPELRLERFSSGALRALLDEVALQGHLLAHSFLLAVARRSDTETARRVGAKQMNGIVGLTAKRLAKHLRTEGALGDIARVIELHPAFRPRAYVALDVSLDHAADGTQQLLVTMRDCPALHESDSLSWAALLAGGNTASIDALIQAVNPRARCSVARGSHEHHSPGYRWSVAIDQSAEPAGESDDVVVASFSTGADFAFT
ncbi:MAG: hypothetical protein HYX32_08075 [Actinobacteria bacterium]|nr:hypothetical protein [Actinomycetota bacterium]